MIDCDDLITAHNKTHKQIESLNQEIFALQNKVKLQEEAAVILSCLVGIVTSVKEVKRIETCPESRTCLELLASAHNELVNLYTNITEEQLL